VTATGTVALHTRRSVEQVEEGHDLAPKFGPDGLMPCITTDAATGEVLMLGWMNAEALQRTLATREAHYWSRSRQVLWHKGGTSGLVQHVVELRIDDDQDALRLPARLQAGPQADPASCHVGDRSCFYRAIDPATSALRFVEEGKTFDPRLVDGDAPQPDRALIAPLAPCEPPAAVRIGRSAAALPSVAQPGVERVIWRRRGQGGLLRMIGTYRGPGTEWIEPGDAEAVMARPDADAPRACGLGTGDVAVFKGCGWPGQPHDGGILHRSPRIAGTGVVRLVLVIDAQWPRGALAAGPDRKPAGRETALAAAGGGGQPILCQCSHEPCAAA
jgi:phosphoribosyl-AMP cyclohydrolase